MNRFRLAVLLVLAIGLAPGCDTVDPIDNEEFLQLPSPSGTYEVGTTERFFSGQGRDDRYTTTVGDARPLMVQIWYPAQNAAATASKYMESEVASLFAATQDYMDSEAARKMITDARTNAQVDLAVSTAQSRWPVIFFSHGLGGSRSLYTTYVEELASRGYVVVGIDHTFGALGTVFPDGRLIGIRTGTLSPPFEEVVRIWAEDQAWVLDRLDELDASDPEGILTSRLDLTRVGAAGHSTGGSASMEVHTFDPRFDAVASLDGVQVGAAATAPGLNDPTLLLVADDSEFGGTEVQTHLKDIGYRVTVSGTSHYSFTDLPILLDLAGVPRSQTATSGRPPGTLAGERNLDIQIAFLAAFFDLHLKGVSSSLLEGSVAAYPEVEFQRIGSAN